MERTSINAKPRIVDIFLNVAEQLPAREVFRAAKDHQVDEHVVFKEEF